MARVKANVESKKARGLCVGNTGLGETKVERDNLNYIEQDDEELKKLELVKSWRSMGLTHKEILERCIEEGVMTRRGFAPTMSTIGTWVRSVEVPAKAAKRLKVKSDSSRGRKVGTRGHRAEDKDLSLKALLISYINQGLTQSVMTENLREAGIVPYITLTSRLSAAARTGPDSAVHSLPNSKKSSSSLSSSSNSMLCRANSPSPTLVM